eukprot:6233410-Alexandrium_andersonii.AAC.1
MTFGTKSVLTCSWAACNAQCRPRRTCAKRSLRIRVGRGSPFLTPPLLKCARARTLPDRMLRGELWERCKRRCQRAVP